jgi:uncharacterized protein (TIGR02996 family)
MVDELSFFGAIRAQPENDAVRLIFADWLEEHGQQARAEFIRLQCRLAGIDEFDPHRPDLLDREWELLTVYRKRWQPAPPSVLAGCLRDSAFLRGFFARISVPAAALLEHGAEWFQAYPLEELRITDRGRLLGEIVRQPWLGQVSSLDLSHHDITLAELEALLASPHLGRLRRLLLRNVALTPDAVEVLTRSPVLRQLRHLDLGDDYFGPRLADAGTLPAGLGNQLGPQGLQRLITSGHLSGLASLTLKDIPLTEADLSLMASTAALPSLTHLRLNSHKISPEGVRLLGEARGLPALRYLAIGWLAGSPTRDEGDAAALSGSPLLARLETLDLKWAGFGRQAALALSRSKHLGRLRRLDLTQCRVGPEEARLLSRTRFERLSELSLMNGKIGPEGMAALARAPWLGGLTSLDLEGSAVGPEGAKTLAGSTALSNLRSLNLDRNGIGRDGARALADATVLSRLRHLSLSSNMSAVPVAGQLGAHGCRALLLSPRLANLWSLNLEYNSFTDKTASAVAAATPLHQLRRLSFDTRGLTAEGVRALAASPRLPHLLVIHARHRWGREEENVTPVVLEQGKGREL